MSLLFMYGKEGLIRLRIKLIFMAIMILAIWFLILQTMTARDTISSVDQQLNQQNKKLEQIEEGLLKRFHIVPDCSVHNDKVRI